MSISFETYLEITQKKAQYGFYLDNKQWHEFSKIALPHATFRFYGVDKKIIYHEGSPMEFGSREAFVNWFAAFFQDANTLHMFGPPQFAVGSDNTILVTWSMEDQLCFPASRKIADIRGGGYYHEKWILQDGHWWLMDLALQRTYHKSGKSSTAERGG